MPGVDVAASNMGERSMSCAVEFAPAEAEACAEAARTAIDARLRESCGLDAPEFWRVVAKLYARGMPHVTPAEADGMIRPPSGEHYATALGRLASRLHTAA